MPNAKEAKARIKLPVATTAVWETKNPVLLEGELGIELAADGVFAKTGDGETAWSSLPYVSAPIAKKLKEKKTIDGVEFDGSADIEHFCVCETEAATAAKTVSCAGFRKVAGAWVAVKFTVTNTADNATLNVNNTGAASIYYRGSAIGKSNLAAGRIHLFVFDGTHYELMGDLNTTHNAFSGATSESNGARGLVPQPMAGDQGKVLFGNATWGAIPSMSGATDVAPGTAGIVPQPQAGDDTKFLRGDGTYATPSGGGGGNGTSFTQLTKMNVTASAQAPKTVNITLPNSRTFLYGTPNVLKFQSSSTGVVETICEFNNGDASDFVYNSNYVKFDGVMSLKTEYDINVGTPSALGSGYMAMSAEINMTNYKTVESIEAGGDATVALTMTATGGGKGTWTHKIESSTAILLDSSSGAAYDFAGNQLVADWSSLTAAQKETAFGNATGDNPLTTAATLGTFRMLIYGSSNTPPTCTVTAVPKDQLILPHGLISLSSYEVVQKATVTDTVSGNAVSRQAVTPDLETYYVYDTVNEVWNTISPTAAAIVAGGMTSAELADVPGEAWASLTADSESIGFAYALSMTDSAESAYVDLITLTVDMKGTWVGAVHGTDYTFAYTSNTNLQVNLLSSGNWKINYDAGTA